MMWILGMDQGDGTTSTFVFFKLLFRGHTYFGFRPIALRYAIDSLPN